MTQDQAIRSAEAASGRVFRTYERHCRQSDPDSLFELLNAIHSLNDRLSKAGVPDLHGLEEFIALKVLRNFTHHQEEVRANVGGLPLRGYSDLGLMLIVRRDQVERAIEGVQVRWQAQSRNACERSFRWYADAVDVNPCLFNLVVGIYEHIKDVGLSPPEADIAAFEASYEYETRMGFPHYVTGEITAPAGALDGALRDIIAKLPAP